MKVIAIIPAYNEEKRIGEVVSLSKKYCDVLVIDDGSKDQTSKRAAASGARVLYHKINRGYGHALISGINYALSRNYDKIITIDGDGQHNPQDIPKFITALSFGVDIVSGSRFLHSKIKCSRNRKLAIKLLTMLAYLFSDLNLSDIQCGFRAYNSKIFKNLKLEDNSMGFSVELPIKAKRKGYTFMEIPIEVTYFKEIQSFWSALKQGIIICKSILKYSF